MKNRAALVLGLAGTLALYRFYKRVLSLHRNGTYPLATNTLADKLRTILSMMAATFFAPVLLLCRRAEAPRLVYKATAANLATLERCPSLHKYTECFFLGHPFLQTMYMLMMDVWCRFTTPIHKRQTITTPDGGTIGLHWRSDSTTVKKGAPVVVVCPGFCEDSCDYPPYCITEPLVRAGWHVVIYIRRGLSGLPLSTAKPFCLRGYDDFSDVLHQLRAEYPESPLFGVGLSTGAAIVQRYLETTGEHSLLTAGCSFDSGVDWEGNFTWLLEKHPLVVTAYLLKRFKATINLNPEAVAEHDKLAERGDVAAVNWKAVHEAATAHDFFESYHGQFYEHEGTYLQSASPSPTDQAKVGVPLLTMQSESDFIIEHEARVAHTEAAKKNENIIVCICHGGGHTMRCEGWTGSSLWMGQASREFFEAHSK